MLKKFGKQLILVLITSLVLSLISLPIAVHADHGTNLVSNPGFEDGYKEEGPWILIGEDGGGTIIIENNEGNSRNGNHSLKFSFWHEEEFISGSVQATQVIEGLIEGTYTLQAWASGGDNEEIAVLQMFVEDYGGERRYVDVVNTGWGEWHEYTIEDIVVTNETAKIGFIVEVDEVQDVWGFFDDVAFFRVPSEGEITLSDPDTFIKGVDISTLQAIEDAGGKYYYEDEEMDLLDILAEHGVNYIRLRIWNNPVEADGYNDLTKTVQLAERLKQKGFKLLLDFHYSDFWADPGNQVKPAAWEDLSFNDLKSAVYDYTEEVMSALDAVNAYPDMVQIGNEINPGMLLPDGSVNNFSQLGQLIAAGVSAVRDTTPVNHEVKIMLHLAEGGSNNRFVSFFNQVEEHGIDYDVIGLSYYPFWHGTFKQLKDNMDDLVTRYGKEVVVVETSHAYTLDNGDGWGNIVGQRELDAAGFPASVEAQETVVRTVMNTVAHVKDGKGLGIFYWEPAWIPVPRDAEGRYQAGWKSGEGNAWDNQAMFDFNGHALPSLNVFKFLPGDISEKAIVHVMPTEGVATATGTYPELPEHVTVLFNEGDVQLANVVWQEIDSGLLDELGTFMLKGNVSGTDMQAAIEITVVENENKVLNPGFEMSNALDHWQLSGDQVAKIEHSSGNAHSGQRSVNYYSGEDYAFRLSQMISGLDDGNYKLAAWISGGGGEYHLNMFVDNVGERRQVAVTNTGWANWKQYVIEDIEVTSGQVTIGFDIEAPAEVWGNIDDVEFSLMGDDDGETGDEPPIAIDNLVANSDFEAGEDGSWLIAMTGNAEVEVFEVENPAQALSGSYALKYWFSNEIDGVESGTFEVKQTITGLDDGKYIFAISSMGGGGEELLHMFVREHGEDELTQPFANTGWEQWNEFTMHNIEVTSGKATIGIRAEAGLDKWGFFDDAVFYMTEAIEEPPGPSTLPIVPASDLGTHHIGVTELLSRHDGEVVVALADGQNRVTIQRNALHFLEDKPLIIKQGDLSIVVPAAVLQQLSALGGIATDQAQIEITANFITADDAEQTLPINQSSTHYRLGGPIYQFSLKLLTEDGQALQIDQFNEKIQLQFPYDSNELDEQLLGVYYYNDASNEWEYVGGEIDDTGQNIIAQVSHFSKYAVLERDKSFQDIPEQHWAYRVIQVLAAQHVANGMTEDTFAPDNHITRAQFTALLVRAMKLTAEHTPLTPFTDISPSAWYANDSAIAYEAGLIQGKTVNTFAPDSLIKREEMAALVVRAYELGSDRTKEVNDHRLDDYEDANEVSAWARTDVSKVIGYGLMQGPGKGVFRPASHATRAEAAQVIYDLLYHRYN